MQRKHLIETVDVHAPNSGVRIHSQARDGDGMPMKTVGTERDGGVRITGWLLSTVGLLLLISAGLELLAHQVFGQTDVDTLLWALSLGFWTYVLGFAGFLILSVRWLVDWWRVGASRMAMNPLSVAESNRRRFEGPELEGSPHIREQGVTSTVPGRSSWDSNDRNKANGETRVA
jgi:hypothetical protein